MSYSFTLIGKLSHFNVYSGLLCSDGKIENRSTLMCLSFAMSIFIPFIACMRCKICLTVRGFADFSFELLILPFSGQIFGFFMPSVPETFGTLDQNFTFAIGGCSEITSVLASVFWLFGSFWLFWTVFGSFWQFWTVFGSF